MKQANAKDFQKAQKELIKLDPSLKPLIKKSDKLNFEPQTLRSAYSH